MNGILRHKGEKHASYTQKEAKIKHQCAEVAIKVYKQREGTQET